MRSRFDRQLALLNQEVIALGKLCETAIDLIASAMREERWALTQEIAAIDRDIDQMARDIEALSLRLLLQQQPVARDLRQVSAAMKLVTDMERIGDQAEDIAEIIASLTRYTLSEKLHIYQMAEATGKMVNGCVDAYVAQDADAARAVIAYDDVVDATFAEIKQALISIIAQTPEEGEQALDFFMIAKYFERIGDHAGNIAEWVLFSIFGQHSRGVDP